MMLTAKQMNTEIKMSFFVTMILFIYLVIRFALIRLISQGTYLETECL